jgi:uncharacterized protein (TIGR03086 family)
VHVVAAGDGREWGVRPMPWRARGHETQDVTEPDVAATSERRVTELIELGRDREAAELAHTAAGPVDGDRSQTRGGPMDVRSQLDELGPLLARVVGEISPDQLDSSTPCAQFTVQGVLEHMIGGATAFAAAFLGVEPGPPHTADVLADFGPALTSLAEAIHEPGALERTIDAPFGEVPGETFARFVVLDGLVHGWDLATATGQSYEPPDALVAEVESFAQGALASLRDGDTFADAVDPPASATPIERLAAFTGRKL